MKKLIFLFGIGLSVVHAHPFLLQGPKVLSHMNVEQLPRSWQACFEKGESKSIFLCKEGDVALQLSLGGVVQQESSLWEKLKSSEPALEESMQDYFIGPQRKIVSENNRPQEKTIEQVAEYVRAKRIVFYTGAGISLAAGVDDMNHLKALLGMSADFLKYAEYVKNNEQLVLNNFAAFCHRAFTAESTPAHKAIAAIALAKKIQVMTENFDFLHQRSGIMPFEVSAQAVSQNIVPQDMQDVDALVCVGMSADDKGLLQWYKDHNPLGKIIAFNLIVPEYVDGNDWVVLGDLQKTLPAVKEIVLDQKR